GSLGDLGAHSFVDLRYPRGFVHEIPCLRPLRQLQDREQTIMIWTREQARTLIDRALAFSKAEETQVVLTGGDRANVRFARNSVTTSGASSGYSLAISAKFGRKTGTVTSSEFSDASLQRAARNAEEIARLSPDNPEAMPLLGPQTYATVKSYFDDAAAATPEWRAGAVRAALEAAREKKVEAAGS